MSYFKSYNYNVNRFLRRRTSRARIVGFFNNYAINSGDVISVTYSIKGFSFFFEGICISLKNRAMRNPNTSFILRNVIEQSGVEMLLSYYYNRIFRYNLQDYKRKSFHYRISKLFFLRDVKSKLSYISS